MANVIYKLHIYKYKLHNVLYSLLKLLDSTPRQIKNTATNTDGLINWLRQPGLLLHRIQKSMRVNNNQLIKFYGTRTDPAAETKSIGLSADALVPCFLLATWTILS